MSKRDEIITGAMQSFERHGFRGIGVDAVLQPSGASTRTLYKHFGSRDGLVLAVVRQRHHAFMERIRANPESGVAGLFEALAKWLAAFGARGCMLLRAHGEYAGDSAEIAEAVRVQKTEFLGEIGRRVALDLGRRDEALSLQIWLLFEGATAAASVAGMDVVQAAGEAAEALLSDAGRK